ncbi:DUF4422 domain-containing protein, partial [Campylobacter sp. Cr9]|uniref:DUF4422 domain-containing protein n=1 Tax=Campylobacter sp. Cr9 TaxID=2735728 RepID=UPI0030149A2A|nr:DUF4422 domain-containing protein [Campylobacter sp. Cr9]
ILVGYHKPATLLKSEILVPIHLGRAVMNEQSKDAGLSNDDKEWLLSNMIGDDTGDNISYLNRYFCEMTGIYWAWKNYDNLGNPEYFGFMHYRRHFLFKNEVCLDVNTDVKYFNSISNEYLSYCCIFDNDKICKLLLECDIVHVAEYYGKTVYNQFNEDLCNEKYGLDSKIWDLFIDLFLQKFPHEKELFFNFLSTNKHVWYNMFIFKKSIFMSFCSWVFPVLFDLFDSIKCKELDVKGMRIIGFIAERLMSYYIFKHKNDYKVKKFQISFIMNTEIMQ